MKFEIMYIYSILLIVLNYIDNLILLILLNYIDNLILLDVI